MSTSLPATAVAAVVGFVVHGCRLRELRVVDLSWTGVPQLWVGDDRTGRFLMGSPNRRHRLERDFMFAPRRDGATLALRLLDLAGDRDEVVQSRVATWLHEVLGLLPDVVTGDREIDELPVDCVLMALLRRRGWTGSAEPITHSDLLMAHGLVEDHPDDVERKVRAALGTVKSVVPVSHLSGAAHVSTGDS